jgi:DNA polymerase elongation subunit (family B)
MAKENDPQTNNFEFQVCDWNIYHEITGDDEEEYVIQLFGRTEDDKDVCIKVSGFTPFFYVEIPLNWKKEHADEFVKILKNKVSWCCSNNPNYDYDLSHSLLYHKLTEKQKFYNFTNKKMFKFILLVFKSHTAMREFSNILARPLKTPTLTKEPMLYQRYESNIEPHIRFMHINDLSSCGWISINKSKLKENKKYSYCDHSYVVNWRDVQSSSNDDRMAPFKIMGYDIECISCDHNFPQADRKTDKIIQIGITMYRYGSMICYEQHILTLKECANIKGANVECYKTEKGLLRGFAKKMQEIRPDFRAGYNNFGFDDKYIYDRIARIDQEEADKQGINVEDLETRFMDEILKITGKLNNEYLMDVEGLRKSPTYFEIKNLSSSALGDNELKFIQIPGIISIDMMKVIQREHRLIGYKLDNVSANFITETAEKFSEGKESDDIYKLNIFTKSTKALEKDSYIQIMIDDGYSSSPLSEGAKYKVFDIETITENKFNEKENKQDTFTYQCIKTEISKKDIVDLREAIVNPLLKIFWTFAKDDMHHTLINKYFKEGESKRIRQIAKYCLKDCKLVNLLLAKLEIIVNSVGMAKVCHVPLSYLFLRGQGVKIFSLVSKKCREKNFLVPVLRRKKIDANGDDDESYEGATVITPIPGVYLSPIGVLDYSSLYPNSMRERNLSQECYVNDAKYDNLPGYIYHDVHIIMKDKQGKIMRNIDGTPQKEHHRFAQELISDEQINAELKNVTDKINISMEENINRIKNIESFTEMERKTLISTEKVKLEEKISKINDNRNLSEKAKVKLIKDKNEKSSTMIEHLVEIDNLIKKEKDRLEKKLKEISQNNNLSIEDKQKNITKANEKAELAIKTIESKIEPSEKEIEILISAEKENANKKIAFEKSRKYNVVNGKTVRYGILPEILTDLLNKRKDTNMRLEREKDPFKKAILNSLQLAYKVTANSLYGQTGAPTSPIYFLAIAASTTAIGRERLHYAKKIVEENFQGSEVVYGDSVTGDTPLVLKNPDGLLEIKTIADLGKIWMSYEQFKPEDSNRRFKQQSTVNYQIMTANGWSAIRRVIRHKTTKKIFRITTKSGSIDVTEDHSLLNQYKQQIKPLDCYIGMELLHGNVSTFNGLYSYLPENNDKYQKCCQDRLLNSKIKYQQHFLQRLLKDKVITDKCIAQLYYCLFKNVGYNVQIRSLENGYLIENNINEVSSPYAIESIEYLRTTCDDEFVYDLETADGTFHAGVGELIVKNTDSIFVNFHLKDANGNERTDTQALLDTIQLCIKAAKLINDNVPKPQSIVYEKTFHPFILAAKKKYVGLKYTDNANKYILTSMGIVLKRRDNAPIVKIVVGGIINHLLKNRDIEKALEYTRETLRKLMDGKYPIDKFIISKTLKARYKKPSTIAHKVLADRMAVRDPGNKPQINDRIPFVYIVKDMGKKKKKDILQGDLIEHPEHVVQNGLKIDYLYYLEHQIINPASQILELLMTKRQVKKLFDEYIIEEENKRKGRQSMEKWMNSSNKKYGSKSPKEPYISLKKPEQNNNLNKQFENVQFIGKTKRLECQNMDKWMDYSSIDKPISTQKVPNVSNRSIVKKNDIKKEPQNMDKWMNKIPEATNSGEWEPDF